MLVQQILYHFMFKVPLEANLQNRLNIVFYLVLIH